jgi:hypothetical protein
MPSTISSRLVFQSGEYSEQLHFRLQNRHIMYTEAILVSGINNITC